MIRLLCDPFNVIRSTQMSVQTRETPKVLTTEEFADALRVRTETVRRHLLSGDIRGVRIGSGPKAPWRIPVSELRRFTGGNAA
jgi:excisionase family DNA binding protein